MNPTKPNPTKRRSTGISYKVQATARRPVAEYDVHSLKGLCEDIHRGWLHFWANRVGRAQQ